MFDPNQLREAILSRLHSVIDPETGVDVVRMRLIEDLVVDNSGLVSYVFRPSSPLCPIAVPLAQAIWQAIADVNGVTRQSMEVIDYVHAEELSSMIKNAYTSGN